MDLKQLAAELAPRASEWRRFLHRRPETAWEERETAAWLAARLREFGLAPRTVAGTGLLVDLDGAAPGPRLALRADLDALAVGEESGLPFASEVAGRMHACGHDLHTAMLLAAAAGLAGRRGQIAGSVRLLFQPAEEAPPPGAPQLAPSGALAMVADGAMDGVDAVFGVHVMPQLPTGVIGVRAGAIMAGSQEFDLEVRGKGGHAGMPVGTVDALAVGARLATDLPAAAAAGADPREPLIVHLGRFAAGEARTAVAAHAQLSGTMRFVRAATRLATAEKLSRAAVRLAAAFDAEARVSFFPHFNQPVVNDARVIDAVRPLAAAAAGDQPVVEPAPLMAAEDFWAYQEKAPGAYIFLGVGGAAGDGPGLHSPRFNPDEAAMRAGIELWLRLGAHPRQAVGGK